MLGSIQLPLLIAEIAQAHDGSLGNAHAYIDAVADAGADAVKFQTHIAEAESTPSEPWRVRFSRQDDTRFEYWKRMEFTEEQWAGLAKHASDRGLVFLSTPFSLEALNLLEGLDIEAWKVGSGEVTNLPMIRRMACTGRPVLLSSGMSTWEELDLAVEEIKGAGAPLGVLQCTTSYPCPPDRVGLNVVGELGSRYRCPVGLSDHSGTIYPGLAAVALGAEIVEVHVVFSEYCFGPDTTASVTVAEFSMLAAGIKFIHQALAAPVDKDSLAAEFGELRKMFGKSLFAKHDMQMGHIICEDDLALKKPGGGLPPKSMESLIGRVIARPVSGGQMISVEDFD